MRVAVKRHKHLKLEQRKLDEARRVLGVATERETVDIALDHVVAEANIVRAHRRVRAVGGFDDVFSERARKRR